MNPDITPAAREAAFAEYKNYHPSGPKETELGHHVQLAINTALAQAKEEIARLREALNQLAKQVRFAQQHSHSAAQSLRYMEPALCKAEALSQQPNQTGGEPCATSPCQSSTKRTDNTVPPVDATLAVASKGADPDDPSAGSSAEVCPTCDDAKFKELYAKELESVRETQEELRQSTVRSSEDSMIVASNRLAEVPAQGEPTNPAIDSVLLARFFHDTYEELAPSFGYQTREDTKVFDGKSKNGRLMIAVCERVLQNISEPPIAPSAEPSLEDDPMVIFCARKIRDRFPDRGYEEEDIADIASLLSAKLDEKDREIERLKRVNENNSAAHKIEKGDCDRQYAQLEAAYQRVRTERDRALTAQKQAEERLAAVHKHHDESLESDSPVASCNCHTKTPDIQYHKPGCKYRLIMERDQLRADLAAAMKGAE